ncbi:MAG TPA: nitrogen fixation protein NifQ [Burkholderiaceae bacterium]|jgi:nitrogen fixation protein NifQ|nr:nitrogen fixation protein NifQ [Burkholderiaceae bacterium]
MPDSLERRLLDAVRGHAVDGRLPAAAWTAGLGQAEFDALVLLVGACDPGLPPPPSWPSRSRPALLSPLVALLWSSREIDDPWTRLMAGTVACAAFGSRHLWQDLGASGRHEVTALLERHFPYVVAANRRQLKWKHHLFCLLGAELRVPDLRPPHCGDCDELPVCFPGAPGASGSDPEADGTQAK